MKPYLRLMRMHHYIKNLLVFAALACSGQFFHLQKLIPCILGFVSFCAVSSAVYIINDIRDAEKDRLHPVKCNRPIASGQVPVRNAVILTGILLMIAVALNVMEFHPLTAALIACYVLLNIGYSFGLKNIPILDITILVAGFVIRVVYGALMASISVSNWLYLTVIALSFYFALGKRRNELRQTREGETREVLRHYPVSFLDKNMYMCLGLANVFYALWSMDEKTMIHYHSRYLILTVPIVLLITMKYSLDVEHDMSGDPVETLLHDKVLLGLCAVYIIAMFLILYL